MPALHPFRAWRYDPARVGPLEHVATPPYDVISPAERDRLAASNRFNLVHLTLPEPDGELNRYAAAAVRFRRWRATGALRQDGEPTFTRHRQTYELPGGGGSHTRTGLLGLVSLDDTPPGAVRPHERTLAGPRRDRQRLMETVRAHLSPIFMLAPDPDGHLSELLEAAPVDGAAETYTDQAGVHHAVDVIRDSAFFTRVADLLKDWSLLIADGHHRFESATACHHTLREAPDVADAIAREAGRVLVELVSSASPGLTVLPTHRTVAGLPRFDADNLAAALSAHEASVTRVDAEGETDAVTALIQRLEAHGPGALGLLAGRPPRAWLIRRPVDSPSAGQDPVSRLDVVYLHKQILEVCLDIAEDAVESGRHVGFVKDVRQAVALLDSARVQAVFLLNATPLDDLERVTAAGRRMPQKSTYFYPKVPAGLVIHAFD